MNHSMVVHWVAEIRAVAGDPEVAHSEEDDLYRTLLRAIAAGTVQDAQKCAAAALVTQEIEFSRWCA